MKKSILTALLVVPMAIAFAQQTGEKRNIMHALVEAKAAATKIKTRGMYQKVANELIKAIESLRTTVEDITDPVALQQAEEKTRIAAQAIKVLLTAIRANDAMRASEKSKSAARALEEAADILNIEPAEAAAEEVQEVVVEKERYSVY